MSSLYNLFKFLHVLGVTVWIGGMFIMLALSARFSRSRDTAVMRAFSDQGRFLGMAVFGPAIAVTIITGVALVRVGKLSFGLLWITWGMLGVILSIVVGGVIAGRMAAQLSQRIAAGKVDPATVAATQRRIATIGVINLLVLASVVFAMVFKFT